MIVLRALGTAEIDTGVATLTPSQEIVFAAALYLIIERGKRVSRARLASLLAARGGVALAAGGGNRFGQRHPGRLGHLDGPHRLAQEAHRARPPTGPPSTVSG